MKQYINKSDIVEEIERRIKEIDEIGTYLSPKGVLINLLCRLDTLKVKEVDLEYEIEKVKKMQKNFDIKNDTIIEFCAKHFYELGLKAQKGEKL